MSHEITYTGPLNIYNIVVHKVIGSVLHPYALTKCRPPSTRSLSQVKHMFQSVLWHPQRQTTVSILDLKQ